MRRHLRARATWPAPGCQRSVNPDCAMMPLDNTINPDCQAENCILSQFFRRNFASETWLGAEGQLLRQPAFMNAFALAYTRVPAAEGSRRRDGYCDYG